MKHTFRLRRQAGVGIVTAIFLLVVLAGLGVAMVGIYTSQQSSANIDLLGAQAYQAARAGLEWGIFQRRRSEACAPKSKIAMPAGTSLSAFTVYVTCTPQGAGDLTRYFIRAEACNMPDTVNNQCPAMNNPESVRRTLEAEL
jgi:MSHA biogenesis protein MshP